MKHAKRPDLGRANQGNNFIHMFGGLNQFLDISSEGQEGNEEFSPSKRRLRPLPAGGSHFQKATIPQEAKTLNYLQKLSTGISMLRHDGKMAAVRNPSPSPRIAEVHACGRVRHRIRRVYHWLR